MPYGIVLFFADAKNDIIFACLRAGQGTALTQGTPPCGTRKALRTRVFLALFDRCGNCVPPVSAAGSGGPQFRSNPCLPKEKVSRFDRKTSKGVHRLFRGVQPGPRGGKFQRGFKMNSSGVLFTQVCPSAPPRVGRLPVYRQPLLASGPPVVPGDR